MVSKSGAILRWTSLRFPRLTMLFNLLCAPCFAAMGAIKTEMNSAKWTWGAIGYMTVFAYAISLIVFQLEAGFRRASLR